MACRFQIPASTVVAITVTDIDLSSGATLALVAAPMVTALPLVDDVELEVLWDSG